MRSYTNKALLLLLLLVLCLNFIFFTTLLETKSTDLIEWVLNLTEVKKFLATYPKATVQGYFLSKTYLEKNKNILEDCKIELADYWFFKFFDERNNASLKLWIRDDNVLTKKSIACIIKRYEDYANPIILGVYQPARTLTLKKATIDEKKLYFYSLFFDKKVYLTLNITKKPNLYITIDPPLHLYKSFETGNTIPVNLILEPQEFLLSDKPTKKLGNYEEYIKPSDFNGYVKAKFVKIKFFVPAGSKGEGELEIIAVGKWFEDGKWVVQNQTITYHLQW